MTDLLTHHTPAIRVRGEDRPELVRDLGRLEITEDGAGMRRLVARFIAFGPRGGERHEPLYLDRRLLDFGARLEVALGPADRRRTLFEGAITAIEADFAEGRDGEVVLFAEDRLMELRMTRRMRTYRDVSDGDVARRIADDHGLAADVDVEGPTYRVLQQWNQSDLAFLRERARRLQAEVWVDGTTLSFKARAARRPTRLALIRGNELIDVQLRADLAHQRSRVNVSGFDAQRRATIDEEAGEDALRAEAHGGPTGISILRDALGERVSYRIADVPLIDREAREWASAELLRRARAFVTVTGVTAGSPDMVVGTELALHEVGAVFEGDGYRVVRVCHSFDVRGEGHRTHFEAQRAHLTEAS